MKRDSFIFLTVFIILLSSCEKAQYFKSGFDSPVTTNSNGLVIANISRNTSYIYLSGYFSLSEGEAEVHLFNSEGIAVYSKTLRAPVYLHILERFIAEPGNWRLSYKSDAGVGEINLHIYNLDE